MRSFPKIYQRNEVLRRRLEGMTFAAIGAELGVSGNRARLVNESIKNKSFYNCIDIAASVDFLVAHPSGLRFLTHYDNFYESGAA